MKKTSLFALLAVAGSTTAFAAPRESATFTGVVSNGRLGSVFNSAPQTATFTGVDGAGAYTAQHLRIAGDLGGSGFPTEAAILVTPPTGSAFIVKPNAAGTTTSALIPAGAYTVPVDAFSTAGVWTFQFFELFDDGFTSSASASAVDGTWTSITFTLDDAPAPTGAAPTAGQNVALTNVDVDGLASAGFSTVGFTLGAQATDISQIRLSGVGTGRSVSATTNVNANPAGRATFQLVSPSGALSSTGTVLATGSQSSSAGAVTLSFSPAIPAASVAGSWTLRAYNTAGNDNPGIDSTFPTLMVSVVAPPASTPLNIVSGGAWASASSTITNPGDVAWFTFTAPATLTATGYLDLDVVGTSLSPANDTDMAMFLATGALVDSDELDGPGELSQLSYGTGNRARTGSGSNYSGQDGTIAAASTTGISPGGVYYVAVAGGNAATHGAGYLTVGGANTGSVTLRGRALDSGATVESPSATAITLTEGAFASATGTIANAGEIAWFTFTTTAGLDATGGVDIDTVGTNLSPANDTDIGLYTAAGLFVDGDEDDSTDLLSQLSYGPVGTRRDGPGNGLKFRGQDGTTAGGTGNVAANTQYFLAVAGGNLATQGSTFNPSAAGPNTGSVTARVRIFSTAAPIDPLTPPVADDLGTFTSTVSPTEVVVTATNTITNGNDVKWYKFTTAAIPAADPVLYMDIDTEGTAEGVVENTGGLQDTEIGLYTSAGALEDDDDDSGNGFRSQLTYGNTTARTAIPPVAPATAGLPRNGADGGLLAGTYYLSVSTWNTTFGTEFTVTSDGLRAATVGDRKINIRTNLSLPPTQCTLSDVAGENQSVGPDNQLTADDIIVFLSWYFASDIRADVAGENQSTTPDGAFTADDIIVFLARYFAGC